MPPSLQGLSRLAPCRVSIHSFRLNSREPSDANLDPRGIPLSTASGKGHTAISLQRIGRRIGTLCRNLCDDFLPSSIHQEVLALGMRSNPPPSHHKPIRPLLRQCVPQVEVHDAGVRVFGIGGGCGRYGQSRPRATGQVRVLGDDLHLPVVLIRPDRRNDADGGFLNCSIRQVRGPGESKAHTSETSEAPAC